MATMTDPLRGKAAVVGAALHYYKRGTSPDSERKLVLRAIVDACADAGVAPTELDGFCSFGDDHHSGPHLVGALGTHELRWCSMVWGGGGGGLVGAIESAAMAIATGQATTVVVYRGLAERDSGRQGAAVSRGHLNAHFLAPGIISPAQICALRSQRMIERDGVPESCMRALVSACYFHARGNPGAQGFANTFDAGVYEDARWISEPFGLYDCSRENDGAGAIVLVAADRAKDLAKKPVYLLAAAQGGGQGWGDVWENHPDYGSAGYKPLAKRLWQRSGLNPSDVDVLQVYENFSGQAVASIIDHGFCSVEEAGEYLTFENLVAPGGRIPTNTAGGNLGEGFVHGIGLAIETVRQLRGESSNPVPGAQTCLLVGGPGTPLNSTAVFGTADTL